jgi:cyclopropane-fatty-acyl-phospholipid synthase
MLHYDRIVQDLLSRCQITTSGSNPWDIKVNDDRFFPRVFRDKELGLGESYTDGWWDCAAVDQLVSRILSARLNEKVRGSLKLLAPLLGALLFNRQTKSGSRYVAKRHYNLGNDLFLSFLDPYNQYSCAYFYDTDDLNQAQLNKLDLICRKLELTPYHHVLDIGSGWGGLSRYLAEKHGCTVTGVNVSEEQIRYAREFCKDLPVSILHCDYRDIRGQFDRIVSVGMFEHVGRKNYRTFMEMAHRCLKDDGVFLLHTIGNNDSQLGTDPWIAKYIFPNGELPSIAQITKAIERLFVVEDVHNLGPHYDRTLMAWHDRFQRAWPRLRNRYDERFKRMWEYYLLSCAGAFRARIIQVWQIVLTKYRTPQPACRVS